MSDWFVGSEKLTAEQRQAAALPIGSHTLVTGHTGTGKTLVSCHRAARHVKNSGMEGAGLKIFVATDINLAFLRREMDSIGLFPERADTFERWCRALYQEHISRTLPVFYLNGRVDEEKTRAGVLDLLHKRPDLQGTLDQVILDDAQEFTPDTFEILKLVSRGVHLFYNPDPSLFGLGIPEKRIRGIFGLSERSAVLKSDFRCPEMLAGLAANWLDDGQRDSFFERLQSGAKGEPPVYYAADGRQDELDRLADFVRQRVYSGDRVGILVTQPRLVHSLAAGLAAREIEVEKVVVADAQNVFHPPYDFGRLTPKITTYEMGRGLTFDVVLMPCLTREAFQGLGDGQIRYQLFSGISRARKWAHLSAVEGVEFEKYSTLKKAAMEGTLIVNP
jgi:hypothetical protein